MIDMYSVIIPLTIQTLYKYMNTSEPRVRLLQRKTG